VHPIIPPSDSYLREDANAPVPELHLYFETTDVISSGAGARLWEERVRTALFCGVNATGGSSKEHSPSRRFYR
jgi:hypothetical protein